MSRRGQSPKVERGDICVEREVRVSTYARQSRFFPPTPLDKTQSPSSRSMRHLRAEARSCMVRKGCIRGGSRGGTQRSVQYVSSRSDVTIVHLPKIDTSVWPACHWGHWQLPRSTIEGEERRGEERRGCRGCDEGMWTYGHPFYTLLC